MNCKCGIRAFSFEKITNNGRFMVYRCEAPETKKKVKCDFKLENKTGDISHSELISKTSDKNENLGKKVNYMKELDKYINLCKITQHLPSVYSDNYRSNINYILNKFNTLNFNCFFLQLAFLLYSYLYLQYHLQL